MFVPAPPAPPPMKFITSNERGQLSSTRDAKARVKASLELGETRLLRAEQFAADQRYIASTYELGIYQAIVEDVLRFMGKQKSDHNKTRDLYKRLEIELREHWIRLEAIRRVTPSEYAGHIKAVADFTDDARTNALNGFFSDTVLQQGGRANTQSPASENSTGASDNPPNNQL